MAKSKSAGAVASSNLYKSSRRWETNRMRRLMRDLANNPNNSAQIELAMKNITWRRKTPTARVWSHSMRRQAELFKRFVGKVSMDMFSSNDKLSAPALMLHGNNTAAKQAFRQDRMMSLGARAHNAQGALVWG